MFGGFVLKLVFVTELMKIGRWNKDFPEIRVESRHRRFSPSYKAGQKAPMPQPVKRLVPIASGDVVVSSLCKAGGRGTGAEYRVASIKLNLWMHN